MHSSQKEEQREVYVDVLLLPANKNFVCMPFVAPGFLVLVIESMHVCSSVKQSHRAMPGLGIVSFTIGPLCPF